jgi:Flp pilus assembly protein TadD
MRGLLDPPTPGRLRIVRSLFGIVLLAGGFVAGGNAGAAGADPVLSPERWEQAIRENGIDPSFLANPLETTPEMEEAAKEFAGGGFPDEQLKALQKALFDPRVFPFNYESRGTYTAAEAFESRSGNCVSFTNLFIAMSRSIGLPVQAALALQPGDSEKEGNLVVVNTHVVAVYPIAERLLIFDFNLNREDYRPRLRVLDDLWVTAMYANNLAVEELRQGNLQESLRYAEAAISLAPDFVDALSNLGVLRRKAGDNDGAFDAYRRALDLAPGDPGVLNNLAALYQEMDMPAESRAAMTAARVRDTTSVYLILVRGNLEVASGNLDAALDLFRRARWMERDIPEPFLGIARVELLRGRKRAARRAVNRALRIDPDNPEALSVLEAVERLP